MKKKMTLKQKQEKIVDYILHCDNLYEEVLWLVQKVTPTTIEVLEHFDGIFMDEDDNVVFEEN